MEAVTRAAKVEALSSWSASSTSARRNCGAARGRRQAAARRACSGCAAAFNHHLGEFDRLQAELAVQATIGPAQGEVLLDHAGAQSGGSDGYAYAWGMV